MCPQVLQCLRQDPKQWHGFWFGPPITSQRELKALHSLKDCEVHSFAYLCICILHSYCK